MKSTGRKKWSLQTAESSIIPHNSSHWENNSPLLIHLWSTFQATGHIRDHLFVLCRITWPKQHFIESSPSSPRKKICLEPWMPSYHLVCYWKNIENNPEKVYHISFCSQTICWSVKPVYVRNTSSSFFSQGTSMSQNNLSPSPCPSSCLYLLAPRTACSHKQNVLIDQRASNFLC